MKRTISILLIVLLLLTSCNSNVSVTDETTVPYDSDVPESTALPYYADVPKTIENMAASSWEVIIEEANQAEMLLKCYKIPFEDGDREALLKIWADSEKVEEVLDVRCGVRFYVPGAENNYFGYDTDYLTFSCNSPDGKEKYNAYCRLSGENSELIRTRLEKYYQKISDNSHSGEETTSAVGFTSPASPYILRKTDAQSLTDMQNLLRFINENGCFRYAGSDEIKYAINEAILSFPNTIRRVEPENGIANLTSDAMEKAGFTTIWVNNSYYVRTGNMAWELINCYNSELKFACPVDFDDDGDHEILYYCEFGNTGSAYNQLRLLDPQTYRDRLLADDIFAMKLTPVYDESGEMVDVLLLEKSVKTIVNSLPKDIWHIKEDEDIMAVRGPSPWLADAMAKPSTRELNSETERMYRTLRNFGYWTTSGVKSAEDLTSRALAVLNLSNPTPDALRVDGDYVLNGKGYAILTLEYGSIYHFFFYDRESGYLYRPDAAEELNVWMAKPVDVDGDGHPDIVYYCEDLSSGMPYYRLSFYDVWSNHERLVAYSYKMLPVTYDKDHIYLGGTDLAEYYSKLQSPVRDYYYGTPDYVDNLQAAESTAQLP